MRPIGSIVVQPAVRLDRPVNTHAASMERIPGTYREEVVGETPPPSLRLDNDEHCLATLRQFRSLMPLAQEAGT